MEASALSSRRPIDVGRVISEVFALYSRYAAPLLFTAIGIFLVVGTAGAFLNNTDSFALQLVATALQLVATALYTGFVVKLVEDVRDGQRDFSVGQLFSASSRYIGTLIVNGVLWAVAIAIGLLALIVPGLYLATIWAVCQPAIVSENKDAIEAFSRSRDLVRGDGWPVFGAILIAILIQLAVAIIAVAIGAEIGLGALIAASILASTLTAPIQALVATVLFFDLGGGKPEAPGDRQVVVEY